MANKLEGLSNVSSHNPSVGRDASQEATRLEFKELKEQERRQCSII